MMKVLCIFTDEKTKDYLNVGEIYEVYEVKDRAKVTHIPKKTYTVFSKKGFFDFNADHFKKIEEIGEQTMKCCENCKNFNMHTEMCEFHRIYIKDSLAIYCGEWVED